MAAPSRSNRTQQSIRGRSHERVNEKVAGSAGSLDHLSPANEWPSREAKLVSMLVSMLRVYCSRYMDDWDKHLPQVMGA